MTTRFFSADIFQTENNVGLAHGCNCAGAMGKGIAVEFKHRWPAMYTTYKSMCASGEFTLGSVFLWTDEVSGRTIFNLGTQRTWRTKATLDAVETATAKMLERASESGVQAIAMPLVGAGLGGLPAEDVKQVLMRLSADSTIDLLVCDEFVKGKAPS
ncbi:MAG: macro domain-containing protein [Planctomycetaceae bacterium]